MGRRKGEVGKLTKQLSQLIVLKAAFSKEPVTVLAESESHKANLVYQDEAWTVTQKRFVAFKSAAEERRAQLDAAGIWVAELEKRRDEASALAATGLKKLLQV